MDVFLSRLNVFLSRLNVFLSRLNVFRSVHIIKIILVIPSIFVLGRLLRLLRSNDFPCIYMYAVALIPPLHPLQYLSFMWQKSAPQQQELIVLAITNNFMRTNPRRRFLDWTHDLTQKSSARSQITDRYVIRSSSSHEGVSGTCGRIGMYVYLVFYV